ncbi:MAG: glycosyltransferase [Candidatus Babeliales bacterium]
MNKIRIVHVISSLKIGGAEAMLCDLISHLDLEQFDNHIIYFHEGPHVLRLRRMGVPTYHITGFFCRYDPVFCLRFLWRIFRLRPHCLHTSLWSANVLGGLVARLFRIPYINAIHLATNKESEDVNTTFRMLLDRLVFNGAYKIVTVSDDVASQLHKNYAPTITPARVAVIKNGIDHIYIHAQAEKMGISRQSLGLSDRHFIIGTVGRLIPRKNHAWLLDIFASFAANHSLARLIIVGEGQLENTLKDQVRALRLEDKVLFITGGASAYPYYPLFDCFALPSLSEGLSIALLEAMSFGIPSIVAHPQKIHEVIKEGVSGFIVDPTNPLDFLEVLEKLKTDKSLRKRIGTAAHKEVQSEFNVDRMVQGYTAAFKEAYSARSAGQQKI